LVLETYKYKRLFINDPYPIPKKILVDKRRFQPILIIQGEVFSIMT